MKRKINVLLIGTASRAQSLIRTMIQLPDVKIAALCRGEEREIRITSGSPR
jgi:hypothetical protein